MTEAWERVIKQVVLLAALWLLLEGNASNFDITEYRVWIGMVITGLAAETAGHLIRKRGNGAESTSG